MKIKLVVDKGQDEWNFKLSGKLLDGQDQPRAHMLAYFDQVKIEFKDDLYEPVNWLKMNEKAGSLYD